uniref:Uncharacterized protein n=2 Tax=Lotharella globosa TaxID=91324 RepID=A0A7S3YY59_9EUKA
MDEHIAKILYENDKPDFYDSFLHVLKQMPTMIRNRTCHKDFEEGTNWYWWITRFMMTSILVGIGVTILENSAPGGSKSDDDDNGVQRPKGNSDLPALHSRESYR